MLFLSHLYFASKIAFSSSHNGAYLLGSVLPDIRYLVASDRSSTHISASQMEQLSGRVDPDLLAGMRTHLLLDECADETFVTRLIAAYPFWARPIIKPRIAKLALEILCLDYFQAEPIGVLGAAYSPALAELGIDQPSFDRFIIMMNAILADLSIYGLERQIESNQALRDNHNIDRYRKIGKWMLNTRWVRSLLTSPPKRLLPTLVTEFKARTSA